MIRWQIKRIRGQTINYLSSSHPLFTYWRHLSAFTQVMLSFACFQHLCVQSFLIHDLHISKSNHRDKTWTYLLGPKNEANADLHFVWRPPDGDSCSSYVYWKPAFSFDLCKRLQTLMSLCAQSLLGHIYLWLFQKIFSYCVSKQRIICGMKRLTSQSQVNSQWVSSFTVRTASLCHVSF